METFKVFGPNSPSPSRFPLETGRTESPFKYCAVKGRTDAPGRRPAAGHLPSDLFEMGKGGRSEREYSQFVNCNIFLDKNTEIVDFADHSCYNPNWVHGALFFAYSFLEQAEADFGYKKAKLPREKTQNRAQI